MKYLMTPSHEVVNSEFISCLRAIHPVPEEALAIIHQKSSYLFVKKGKFIRSALDKEEKIYFIVKGCVRGFVKDDGMEITTWITNENNIVGSIRNLGCDVYTEEYLQVLEDSQLIQICRRDIEDMYESFPEANIIARKILEIHYRDAEERAFLSRLPSAQKRYNRFVLTRPELVGRVPIKYIASYLGMKLETLCRIRTKNLHTL